MLAADQDTFFKDADGVYTSRYINSDFLSDRKLTRRELSKNKEDEDSIQSQLIELALREGFGRLRDDPRVKNRFIIKLAKKILLAVIREAKSTRSGVRKWLYSMRHVALNEDNREFYEDQYQVDDEGYVDKSRVFPEDPNEQRRFILKLLEERKLNQPGMLNMDVCKQDFDDLLLQDALRACLESCETGGIVL